MGPKIFETFDSKTTLDSSISKQYFLIFLYPIVHTFLTKTYVIFREFYYKLFFRRLNGLSSFENHSPLYYLFGYNMTSIRFKIFYGVLSLFALITLYILADPVIRKIILGATVININCIAVALSLKTVKSKENIDF